MSFTFSLSDLRNEVYIRDTKNDVMLFSIQGFDISVDFTKMSNDEIESFILTYYQEVIDELTKD